MRGELNFNINIVKTFSLSPNDPTATLSKSSLPRGGVNVIKKKAEQNKMVRCVSGLHVVFWKFSRIC